MFAEPLSVKIGTETKALPRVTMEKFRSGWGDPSSDTSVLISHNLQKGEQSIVRLDLKKVVDDPLDSTSRLPLQASAWLVVKAPANQLGFTDTELGQLATAVADLVKSSGFLEKFLQKES